MAVRPLLLVAGLSLKNLEPRVWDPASPYHLPELRAIMVSYADFVRRPALRRAAMERGLHDLLTIPGSTSIYLDNGSFYFLGRNGVNDTGDYERFVAAAGPDWWPIPQDFIPTPQMTESEQRECVARTMAMNAAYRHDGYVPVVHVGRLLGTYVTAVRENELLAAKPSVALGGIVPNLLRSRNAIPYDEVVTALRQARDAFAGKRVHVFGVGGTATLHLVALLGMDSVDSSGWRNRAARGIIQLPGRGDRMIANLGTWRGREPNAREWEMLAACGCPACRLFGVGGLKGKGLTGFCNRATHNLAVLLDEVGAIQARLADDSYASWYQGHLENSIYLPLIRRALAQRHIQG